MVKMAVLLCYHSFASAVPCDLHVGSTAFVIRYTLEVPCDLSVGSRE